MRTYQLPSPGTAHVYNEGDLHSPRRETDTRLIRIEGIDLSNAEARQVRNRGLTSRPAAQAGERSCDNEGPSVRPGGANMSLLSETGARPVRRGRTP